MVAENREVQKRTTVTVADRHIYAQVDLQSADLCHRRFHSLRQSARLGSCVEPLGGGKIR